MLAVDEAQARLFDGVVPLAAETVPFAAALGRILAADVVAKLTQPPFAASAMDGYAIRWADRAGPWRLTGESAAGRAFDGTVGPGDTVRILTGAPLPAGADTVVVQEDVARDGDTVTLTGDGPPREGAHIRRAGLDFAAGQPVARAGDRVTPARIGVSAAAGHAAMPVHRRPRVAILATGDELVPPGVAPGPSQIVSSNGVMLAALLGKYAEVIDGGIVADTREALAAAFVAHDVDVLVTIGGASVGDHDLVQPVLRE
ncbi:MAG: molybdopterin molybdotransferase MoeA, partial [Janthinobacterium lividum]